MLLKMEWLHLALHLHQLLMHQYLAAVVPALMPLDPAAVRLLLMLPQGSAVRQMPKAPRLQTLRLHC